MQKYELGRIYADLRRAVVEGRLPDANALLSTVLGLDLDPTVMPGAGPDLEGALASDLSFRDFKSAELAMLAANLKPVVKFEDIPLELAGRFARRHGAHYRVVVGPQYFKDYLLLRSSPADRTASDRRTRALVCIYASRDDSARKLMELEQSDRENVFETGKLLGFPSCCIEAFAADFERSRNDQDALNDEACRRLAATATTDRPGHPALNPLSNHELLGFYACDMRCEAATAYARRTAAALARVRRQHLVDAQRRLGRPCLFWRLPFFINFEGEAQADEIRYRKATVNVFPDAEVGQIQRLFASHLMPAISRGDRLTFDGQELTVYAGQQVVQRWGFDGTAPPLLMAFEPWNADWQDLLLPDAHTH